jgi:anti-sigma-K factor RskA
MKNQSSSDACLKFEPVLEDFLEGQLNASDVKDLRTHLAECDGCRGALADAEESLPLLRLAQPVEAPGPQFSRVVMARIRANEMAQTEERASFWRPFVALAWRFAATAAVALILLVTYDVVGNTNIQSGVTSVNQTEVNQPDTPSIFTPESVASPATRDDTLLMVAETNYGSN